MQGKSIAYKLWIADILKSKFVNSEAEFEPSYLLFNDLQVSKINIIGTVADSFKSPNETFSSITLDDGSATISLRAFKEKVGSFDSLKIGDLIFAITRPREYQGQIYLIPDIIRCLEDFNWDVLRKIELFKLYGKLKYEPFNEPSFIEQQMQEKITESQDVNLKNKLLVLIDGSGDNGIEFDSIKNELDRSEEEIKPALNDLAKDGLIFQAKPGTYKRI